MLARMQNEQNYADRRKERDVRRRSQAPPNMPPPSPALVRHGSKHGAKVPAALTPGQMTPHSAQAQVHIPIGNNQRGSLTHPYATGGGVGVGFEHSMQYDYKIPQVHQQPRRQSPMASNYVNQSPIAAVRPMDGSTGIGHDGQDYLQGDPPKPSILRILTCRC